GGEPQAWYASSETTDWEKHAITYFLSALAKSSPGKASLADFSQGALAISCSIIFSIRLSGYRRTREPKA
ncbi:13099_t:CDS:2, partial [Acaulospora colombiana]